MALYQMVDGSTHKKGELAILTALEAIRERARTCRNGADFSKRKGIKPIKNGEELKKASAEADAAMAEYWLKRTAKRNRRRRKRRRRSRRRWMRSPQSSWSLHLKSLMKRMNPTTTSIY